VTINNSNFGNNDDNAADALGRINGRMMPLTFLLCKIKAISPNVMTLGSRRKLNKVRLRKTSRKRKTNNNQQSRHGGYAQS
jgi:hypothetical protein